MRERSWFGTAVIVGIILVSAGFFAIALRLGAGSAGKNLGAMPRGEGVGILSLEGVILDSNDFVEDLITFRDDDNVKAIVIRADSPGGAVGPSQEMFAEIRKVAAKKPIITSIGALCASGCYYAAVGTQRIFANPGSLVGSIGVIMPLYEAKELFDWAKIHPQFIKSGPMKDIGHPAKPLNDDERAALQSVVDNTYAQFVTAVATGRAFAGMTTEEVRTVADGRIFTGEQSLGYGMVDELGTFRDAVAYAGKLGKIDGEPKQIHPKKDEPKFFEYFLDQAASSVKKTVTQSVREAAAGGGASGGMFFLWKP